MSGTGGAGEPVRIVLSGSIGSGKSAVGAALRRRGAAVIDADLVGHAVLEPGGAAHDAVKARWPEAVRDGHIDRAALATVVFADPEALAGLETITHPAIRDEVLRRVAEASARLVVVEVPVLRDLFGPGWQRVVVLAPREVRRQRCLARGMDGAEFDRRDAAQATDDEWRAAADHVIVNDGTLDDLEGKAERLMAGLTG